MVSLLVQGRPCQPSGASTCVSAARQADLTHPSSRPPRSAAVECDVPLEMAFALWEDRERIPLWMPWITSVVVRH